MPLNALPAVRAPEWVEQLDVPHVHEYFGVWAVQEEPFRAGVERVNRLDLRAHVEAAQGEAQAGSTLYAVAPGGVAVIDLAGPLMKFRTSLSGGTSTVFARRQVRQAAGDEEVRAIVLRIDSPGGTVSGTRDLADEVAAAAKRKPVLAYVEDLAASAAYWIASQATAVYANATALVGSIGTFAVLWDQSAQAAQMGIKVHVVRAGDFKGAGTPGTEVTHEQLVEWQRLVNELNEHFLAGVAAGRRLPLARVRSLADGRVHVGASAVDLGLIDAVQTFDKTIQQARTQGSKKAMSETTQTPAQTSTVAAGQEAASYHELVAGCPGADAPWLCGQLEKRATLALAQQAWMAEQLARLTAARQETEKHKAAAEAAGKRPGQEPLVGKSKPAPVAESDAGDFDAAVQDKMRLGMARRQAVLAVCRERPDLHQAFLLATNRGSKKQALIAERFAN